MNELEELREIAIHRYIIAYIEMYDDELAMGIHQKKLAEYVSSKDIREILSYLR